MPSFYLDTLKLLYYWALTPSTTGIHSKDESTVFKLLLLNFSCGCTTLGRNNASAICTIKTKLSCLRERLELKRLEGFHLLLFSVDV